MLPILNLAIGLVFVFLLFSLVVSALNELILSALNKRADFLEEGLAEMLADPAKMADGPLAKLLGHGLVDSLSRSASGKPGKPAYLPPQVFVSALLDQVSKPQVNVDRTIKEVEAGIDALGNPKLKESLTAILQAGGQDLTAFKTGLETWFNQGMERVSGWYKRYTQQWMFVLGLLLAIACNVDTIHITNVLSSDPQLRDTLVKQAVAYAKQESGSSKASPQTPVKPDDPPTSAGQSQKFAGQLDKFENALTSMNATGLPLGWDNVQLRYFNDASGSFAASHLLLALFGWLVTALAASLGAPFWFDTLNRFVTIRGNGRAPEEGDPTNPGPKTAPSALAQTAAMRLPSIDSVRSTAIPTKPLVDKLGR